MCLCAGVLGLSLRGGTSAASAHPIAAGGLQAVAGDHQQGEQGGNLLLLSVVQIYPFTTSRSSKAVKEFLLKNGLICGKVGH